LWALAMYRNLRTRGKMRADEVRQQVFASGCHRADRWTVRLRHPV